jgi:hypothetical protein
VLFLFQSFTSRLRALYSTVRSSKERILVVNTFRYSHFFSLQPKIAKQMAAASSFSRAVKRARALPVHSLRIAQRSRLGEFEWEKIRPKLKRSLRILIFDCQNKIPQRYLSPLYWMICVLSIYNDSNRHPTKHNLRSQSSHLFRQRRTRSQLEIQKSKLLLCGIG